MASFNYSIKDVLEKEFKTKMRGYDPVEVDEFLDNIINDYKTYQTELIKLQEDNQRLLAKVEQLSKAQATMSRIQTEPPKTSSATNFDILKRISNLEKEVFGKKLEAEQEESRPAPAYFPEEDPEDLEATRKF